MAIQTQTCHAPYVTVIDNNSEGVYNQSIFDYIKVTSDDADDAATIDVIPIGATVADTIKVTSGNNVYGPFSSFNVTALSTDAHVIVHERHAVLQDEIVVKDALVTTGYTQATHDTYQIQGVLTANGDIESFSMEVTASGGLAAAGTYDVNSAEITSISRTGLITFVGTASFDNDFAATITYKQKLHK